MRATTPRYDGDTDVQPKDHQLDQQQETEQNHYQQLQLRRLLKQQDEETQQRERKHPIEDGHEVEGWQTDETNEEQKLGDPLLSDDTQERNGGDREAILLTQTMEEEILGPESFTTCGVGWLAGKGLQKLARAETYLVAFSLALLADKIFFTYCTGTISTVERRFNLPSSVSGFISTGNDILQILLSVPLAYAAGHGHRPRWMAGGLLLSAGGSLLIMLPHVIFGAGDYSSLALSLSEQANGTSSIYNEWNYCGKAADSYIICEEESAAVGFQQHTVAALQFLGQVFSGLTKVGFGVVGYSYLDEAVSKEKVPFYMALSGCMGIFGVLIGTSLASFMLGLWMEIGVEPLIQPSNPQWVGAWWLGYPVIIAMLVLASLPMMMMPRQLPGHRQRTTQRLRAAAKQGRETFYAYWDSLRPVNRMKYKEIFTRIVWLCKRKLFVILTVNQTIYWFSFVGYSMFQLKYMENQFNITASESNKAMALVGMLSSLIGGLGTGAFLTFLKPSTKVILYTIMGMSLLNTASYIIQMNIHCERDHVIGLDTVFKAVAEGGGEVYGTTSHLHKTNLMLSSCMSACNCSSKYSPVCVNSSQLFFSPCHAGCKQRFANNGSLEYKECQCADLLSLDNQKEHYETQTQVLSGVCSTGCDNFIYYLAVNLISQVLGSGNRAIANILFLRAVDERDKDLALGIRNVLVSVGLISVPIIVGSLIDYTCVLWQRICGRRGYCYSYNIDLYNWILHGVPAAGMFVSFVTEWMVLLHHEDIDFFGHKEIEQLQLFDVITSKAKERMKRKNYQKRRF